MDFLTWPIMGLALCLLACVGALALMWAKKIEEESVNKLLLVIVALAGVSLLGLFDVLRPWQWALGLGFGASLVGVAAAMRDAEKNGWAALVGLFVLILALLAVAILALRDFVAGAGHAGLGSIPAPLWWAGVFVVLFFVLWLALEGKSRDVESGAHAADRPHGLMAGVAALTAAYIAIGGAIFFGQSGDLAKFGLILALGGAGGFATLLGQFMASSSYGKAGSTSKVSLFDGGVFAVGAAWLRGGAILWPFIAALAAWWKP